ncbi:MAG: hypothetical protein ABIJ10_03095 [Candidatus Micrarchaeota archaeon]|nr:hypothetical protein [Candidatus Micrarchaeota archaeon]MBU1887395.1 hypothetical protein [Candidatus Micrarchaeota archaeon]
MPRFKDLPQTFEAGEQGKMKKWEQLRRDNPTATQGQLRAMWGQKHDNGFSLPWVTEGMREPIRQTTGDSKNRKPFEERGLTADK